jgi:hypothetical protein
LKDWRSTVRSRLKQKAKPLDYVDHLSRPEHIAMLYEDLAYAKCVVYRFLKNGLGEDQHCIIATHFDTNFIRQELVRFGMDVSRFKRRGLLHILRIRDPAKHPKGLQAGIDQIIEQFISTGITSPYRIATERNPFVRDLSTTEGLSAELQIEEMWKKALAGSTEGFGRLGEGLVLCPYFLGDINPDRRLELLEENAFALHDGMIYLPRQFGTGVASRI